MSISDEAGTARRFVASREAFSTAWIKGTKIWQVVYTVFFVAFVGYAALAMFRTSRGAHVHAPRYTGLIFMAVLLGAGVVIGVYLLWRSRQKCILTLSGDALSISSRAGEVYSLADAQLSLWPNNGVALQLRSGNRRFVLGGRDRQIGPATILDAEPMQLVDARLPASEFDELLRLGGRSAARGPAVGEPIRCILYPNAQTIASKGAFAARQKQQLVNSLARAQLFIDVDHDSIRIVEPEHRSVDTSAAVSRIIATPLSYERTSDESSRIVKTPALMLSVPGLPPLSFACPHTVDRFPWIVAPQVVRDPPAYVLLAADWLTLVEKFGLAANVEGAATKR